MTNIKKAGEKSHPFVDYYINIRRIFSIKLANLSRKFANLSRSFPSSRSAGVRIDSSKQIRRNKSTTFPHAITSFQGGLKDVLLYSIMCSCVIIVIEEIKCGFRMQKRRTKRLGRSSWIAFLLFKR